MGTDVAARVTFLLSLTLQKFITVYSTFLMFSELQVRSFLSLSDRVNKEVTRANT
jgi:hypothetical protein